MTDKRFNLANGEITIDKKIFQFTTEGYDDEYESDENESAEVELNERTNQLKNKLTVAPAKDSMLHVLHALNDDCLERIFQKMELRVLCNVANACHRFNVIGKETFNLMQRRQERSIMKKAYPDFYRTSLKTSSYRCFNEDELFLRTFGTEISIFHLHPVVNQEIQLSMCAEYCTNIERLHLSVESFSARSKKAIRDLMPRLKQLTLCFKQECSMGDLFVGDWPLEKMELIGFDFVDWETSTIEMPNLIELHLDGSDEELYQTKKHIEQILSRNPQIRKIKLKGFLISAFILNLIPTYLTDCEEIILHHCSVDGDDMGTLAKCHQLKSLTALNIISYDLVDSTKEILTSLATNNAPLKSLTMVQEEGDINDNYVDEYIAPFDQLETVTFNYHSSNFNILRLAENLNNLSEITFKCWEITASQIKEFIQRISGPLDLSIRIQPYRLECDVAKGDLNEITELLRTCPGIRFKVELKSYMSLSVSFFFFLYLVIESLHCYTY